MRPALFGILAAMSLGLFASQGMQPVGMSTLVAGGGADIQAVNGSATHDTPFATSIAAPAINAASGNSIIVCSTNYTSGQPGVSSVTDTASNSYSKVGSTVSGDSSHSAECWMASNITGNASNVITVNWPSDASWRAVAVSQFSGLGAFDVQSSGAIGALSTSLVTPTTPTTTQADELIIGYFTAWGSQRDPSDGTNGIVIAEESGGGSDNFMAYRIVDAVGTYDVDVTLDSAEQFFSVALTFKAAL